VVLTVVGYEFIFVFTGYAIAVEVVFSWPGLGRSAVQAILHNDVVLVSAIVIVAGVVVSVVNTVLDIAHAAIDRRVAL
jgi:peptide/nickel transport system permease protein